MLHNAPALPLGEAMDAHRRAMTPLLDVVVRRTGCRLRPTRSLRFARRATAQAPELVLSTYQARAIAKTRPPQFIFAGRRTPDEAGKQGTVDPSGGLGDDVPVIYLTSMTSSWRVPVSGVDVRPTRPCPWKPRDFGHESCPNGVPSFSVLDGCARRVWKGDGWAIGRCNAWRGHVATSKIYRKLRT
jgi:hypothetical protein